MSKQTVQTIALVLSVLLNALGGAGVIPPISAPSCPPAVAAPAAQ